MKITRSRYKDKKTHNIPLKRRISLYLSRFFLTTKIVLIFSLIYLVAAKDNMPFISSLRMKVSEILADGGYVLDNVLIMGQHNLSSDDIVASLNADVGTPIFAISLEESKNRLTQNDWVKSLAIQRKLPDTIIVSLLERKPIALWQVNKHLYLIDDEGDIIKNAVPEKFANFIHLVGEGANVHANELIEQLAMSPSLAGKVKYAVRYGQRRWDLNLEGSINVKMPENSFVSAYEYLITMYKNKSLFENSIKSIDLRDSKKIYVEKHPPVKEILKK